MKAGGDLLVCGRVWEQVTGDLLNRELIERHVRIQCPHDPIPVWPDVPIPVLFVTVCVGVSGQVQPGTSPPLSEMRRGEQAIDEPFVSIGPVVLEEGEWLVSVGTWVLPLRLESSASRSDQGPAPSGSEQQPSTQEETVRAGGPAVRRGSRHRPEAAADVSAYFDRNGTAKMAMAFHYQEYILGLPAPQPVPMTEVVVAFDLSGEGAVSDYKKLLQDLIWSERGHPRELAEFLLANGLLTGKYRKGQSFPESSRAKGMFS